MLIVLIAALALIISHCQIIYEVTRYMWYDIIMFIYKSFEVDMSDINVNLSDLCVDSQELFMNFLDHSYTILTV